MNEVMKNLLTRRSIRSYQPDMIPMETIEEIVKAGTYAATGMGQLSWAALRILFMAPPWSSSFLRIKTGERIFTMAAWSWEI